MRLLGSLFACLLAAASARAQCDNCIPGGGPAATDCFVAWSGVPPDMRFTCTDGSASDADGAFDGVCHLRLRVCVNVPDMPGCTPQTLTRTPTVKPAAQSAASTLA